MTKLTTDCEPNGMSRAPVHALRLLVAAAACLCVAGGLGLRVNLTSSIPIGLYRRSANNSSLRRGDIVLVCLRTALAGFAHARGYVPRGGRCPGGTAPVGKLVLALAGDTVTADANGLRVNGTPVPASRALERDGAGRPLPHVAAGQYRVPTGALWVIGSSARSFDSRYFGSVDIGSVIARVQRF